MTPLQFVTLDGTPLCDVKFARSVPSIGEGITLEPVATGDKPRQYRVDDVDRGFVQASPKSSTYKESTVVVYLIDHDDPRREPPR